VDTHVLTVRKKLADDAGKPRFIETLHGVGYQFIARAGD
jgi:DNA-binding response OmpR family regulator